MLRTSNKSRFWAATIEGSTRELSLKSEPHFYDVLPVVSGHVETVCLLSNRKADAKIRINVDLEDYYAIKDAKKSQN